MLTAAIYQRKTLVEFRTYRLKWKGRILCIVSEMIPHSWSDVRLLGPTFIETILHINRIAACIHQGCNGGNLFGGTVSLIGVKHIWPVKMQAVKITCKFNSLARCVWDYRFAPNTHIRIFMVVHDLSNCRSDAAGRTIDQTVVNRHCRSHSIVWIPLSPMRGNERFYLSSVTGHSAETLLWYQSPWYSVSCRFHPPLKIRVGNIRVEMPGIAIGQYALHLLVTANDHKPSVFTIVVHIETVLAHTWCSICQLNIGLNIHASTQWCSHRTWRMFCKEWLSLVLGLTFRYLLCWNELRYCQKNWQDDRFEVLHIVILLHICHTKICIKNE